MPKEGKSKASCIADQVFAELFGSITEDATAVLTNAEREFLQGSDAKQKLVRIEKSHNVSIKVVRPGPLGAECPSMKRVLGGGERRHGSAAAGHVQDEFIYSVEATQAAKQAANQAAKQASSNMHTQLHVVCRDICDLAGVHGIVNPANSKLQHSGGAAYAIASAAGRRLQQGCDALLAQRPGKEVATGAACSTDAYDLGTSMGTRRIIHAVGPKWHGGGDREHKKLAACVAEALREADTHRCSSLALPAISTSIFGMPESEAVPVIVDTVLRYLSHHAATTFIRRVFFVDNSVDRAKAFADTLRAACSGILSRGWKERRSAPCTVIDYQWCWREDTWNVNHGEDPWTPYDQDQNMQIEVGWQDNRSQSVALVGDRQAVGSASAHGNTYQVTFELGEPEGKGQQRNTASGYERPIRRVKKKVNKDTRLPDGWLEVHQGGPSQPSLYYHKATESYTYEHPDSGRCGTWGAEDWCIRGAALLEIRPVDPPLSLAAALGEHGAGVPLPVAPTARAFQTPEASGTGAAGAAGAERRSGSSRPATYSKEDLQRMNVKELKAVIHAAGMDVFGCIETSDLRKRAWHACTGMHVGILPVRQSWSLVRSGRRTKTRRGWRLQEGWRTPRRM